LQLLLLALNETGGLIAMNVIWSRFFFGTTEDSFIISIACGKNWGAQKPESLGV